MSFLISDLPWPQRGINTNYIIILRVCRALEMAICRRYQDNPTCPTFPTYRQQQWFSGGAKYFFSFLVKHDKQ